jgi:hypothetical protein
LRIGDLILSANAVRLRVLVHLPAIGGAIRRRSGGPVPRTDLGEPIGYVARIADPDGNSLELSFGQEVGLAVGRPAER